MWFLALGGVCLQVVIGERRQRCREADPGGLVFVPWCCLLVLDGLYSCLLPSLVMLVGGVVCDPGAVLESVVSGVFPWVVSECECCVLLLEMCVCKL